MPMLPLDDLFFAVCQTAIKNCAWKYSDFEAVKRAEGQLELLRQTWLASPAEAVSPETAPVEALPEKMSNEPTQPTPPQPEAPVASKPVSEKLVSPAEAKTAPERPMPDEILAAVQDGIELAKNPPKVANVKVEALSSDPAEAEMQFKKNF